MNSPIVPSNKLQSRMRSQEWEDLAPGTGTRHTANGQLIEVYDQEKLAVIKLDPLVKEDIESHPGLLFGKVKLPNGALLVLPFKEPEDQIYLTYGNALLLEGRNVKIEFQGMGIESGQIIFQRSYATKQLNIPVTSKVYDVGMVI